MIEPDSTADSLLPGEVLESDVLEDAEHWAAVYEELTRLLLTTHSARLETMGHFHSRLEYWRHRRDELTLRSRGRRGGRRDRNA